MLRHYRMLADYNRWANALLYDAAAQLSDAEYRHNRGAFFGSLHGTLNHILVGDRAWMHRFTGTGEMPAALDLTLHDTLGDLRAVREVEDWRIIDWIDTLDSDALAADISYTPIIQPGTTITHPLGPAVAHFFNHQTHHRGQCHVILTGMGKPSLGLDLIYFLRTDGKRWM
ncbi:DinB family protein [Rhizobium leucaenae]|uniref:Putative damage-inducible protein DinB n=1 Tax=Rhizobium leucaenae TaxID=29450 RepID=A0A7W6ZWR9_9HYPH|nr:DinB family protein [Rhizobium leucaenae]MBB4570191.1 putative damage-inducible protein DinB [Rhizobium leucaenae]MBB6302980.1 putative damage-inducible protein DinB [Rhizobium leucaenae]